VTKGDGYDRYRVIVPVLYAADDCIQRMIQAMCTPLASEE
jgi:hypothetical protein